MSLITLCSKPSDCENHADIFHANFAFSILIVDDRGNFNANNDNKIDLLFSDDNNIYMPLGSIYNDEMGDTRPLTTNKGSCHMFV